MDIGLIGGIAEAHAGTHSLSYIRRVSQTLQWALHIYLLRGTSGENSKAKLKLW